MAGGRFDTWRPLIGHCKPWWQPIQNIRIWSPARTMPQGTYSITGESNPKERKHDDSYLSLRKRRMKDPEGRKHCFPQKVAPSLNAEVISQVQEKKAHSLIQGRIILKVYQINLGDPKKLGLTLFTPPSDLGQPLSITSNVRFRSSHLSVKVCSDGGIMLSITNLSIQEWKFSSATIKLTGYSFSFQCFVGTSTARAGSTFTTKLSRNFKSDKVLGKGGFGTVYKGWLDEKTLTPTKSGIGIIVVVKKMKSDSMQGLAEWQVDDLKVSIDNLYGENPLQSEDISRVVNSNHFARLSSLLDDEKVSGKIIH
ncbi:hypothetical protein IEQ34_014510 [Dendrobium chrysotoxum]|uniref:Uncharacterized protein n=1 Tax=Dendrobium chrysotoxum TaxID=161865 RepID=A0AAV7GM75_DENCH|nr:hypothetical protein IEQ34_014510 [Dendrobium chrysotoxum]